MSMMYNVNLYKPRKNGGGCASQWEYNPTFKRIYLRVAPQIEKENKFDWSKCVTIALNMWEAGAIIAVFKNISDKFDTFHSYKKSTCTMHLYSNDKGIFFNIKRGDVKIGHSISDAEAVVLCTFLSCCIQSMVEKENPVDADDV